MNIIKYSFLISLVLFLGCKPEMDIIEKEQIFPASRAATLLQINGSLANYYVLNNISQYEFFANGMVKLVHDGLTLDEVKVNVDGTFSFDEQLIPDGETFLLAEVPNYFSNIVKINEENPSASYNILLIPKAYEAFTADALEEDKPMIKITGNIVERDKGYLVYALDNNGNLIGNNQIDPDIPHHLELSTLANEEIHLYVKWPFCDAPSPFVVGPFSEDTDIGDIVYDDLMHESYITISGSIESCDGFQTSGRNHFFQNGRYLTLDALGLSGYNTFLQTCKLSNDPIDLLTVFIEDGDYDFHNYTRTVLNYQSGQDISMNIEGCIVNNSSFTYSINSDTPLDKSSFTIASIDNSDQVTVYVDGLSFNNNYVMKFSGSDIGTYLGSLFIKESNAVVGYSENTTYQITNNDGQILEGNFSGDIMSNSYDNIGTVTGSFIAIIN